MSAEIHFIKTNAHHKATAKREAVIAHYDAIIASLQAQLADLRAQLARAREQRAVWHAAFGRRLTKLRKPRTARAEQRKDLTKQ
jgi:hypothetical protein